jgi:hypothetical protein
MQKPEEWLYMAFHTPSNRLTTDLIRASAEAGKDININNLRERLDHISKQVSKLAVMIAAAREYENIQKTGEDSNHPY